MSKHYSDSTPGYYGGMSQTEGPRRKKFTVAIYKHIVELIKSGHSEQQIMDSRFGMSLRLGFEDIQDALDMDERGLFESLSLTREYKLFIL